MVLFSKIRRLISRRRARPPVRAAQPDSKEDSLPLSAEKNQTDEQPFHPTALTLTSTNFVDALKTLHASERLLEIECHGLSEAALNQVFESIASNLNITALCFIRCELSGTIKNMLRQIVSNRVITKIGFDSCGLTEFDTLWLESLAMELYSVEYFILKEEIPSSEVGSALMKLPGWNLKGLELDFECLSNVPIELSENERFTDIKLKLKKPLQYEDVELLFKFIGHNHINTLSVHPLLFADDDTRKRFFRALRSNQTVQSLSLGASVAIERDLLTILLSDNSTLSSITIDDTSRCKLEAMEAIRTRLACNGLMHKARCLLRKEEGDDSIDSEAAHELNDEISGLCASLKEYKRVPSPVTKVEHVLVSLIGRLDSLRTSLNRQHYYGDDNKSIKIS